MTKPEFFKLTGELPGQGITLLEASAGTGKTYAIAALAARFVAAGFPIKSLLIVTFSRAAAGELKSRVHQRLAGTLTSLKLYRDFGKEPEDEVDRLLAQGNVDKICRNLEDGLGKIDEASIATIHEYSSTMLRELGMCVDHDEASVFVEDMSELISEVVADSYLNHWQNKNAKSFQRATIIGRQVCLSPSLEIVPEDIPEAKFASLVREEFFERKRKLRIHGYDDMVNRLTDALDDPETGGVAAEILSERFPIVMVDEFQDTDPQQWRIIEKAFAPKCRVVLIGDPKQAIYGFRGGDVETYQLAKRSDSRFPKSVKTMSVNYRSDPGIVEGVNELFGAANIGAQDSPIYLPPVRANKTKSHIAASGKAVQRPVLVRQIAGENLFADVARAEIDKDIIASIYSLTENYTLEEKSGTRPVRLSDIAILVRSNRRGEAIHQVLQDAGIPAVFTGTSGIFESEAADDWKTLLSALASQRVQEMTRATLTSFFGLTSIDLAADENARNLVFMRMRQYAKLLATRGPISVLEKAIDDSELYSRVLSEPDGQRKLTDLQHIAELLDSAQQKNKLGVSGLLNWLDEQITRTSEQNSAERTRRLETDRSTVTITTIHQAKGLEFPVVLLPEASDQYSNDKQWAERLPFGHLEGRRVIDVEWQTERYPIYAAEDAAELLRLFYVAATRAVNLLICWYASTKKNTTASPLHRLLFELNSGGSHQHINFCQASAKLPPKRMLFGGEQKAPAPLKLAEFTREIDQTFKRTSYSGLTAAIHGTALLEELDEPLEELVEPVSSAGGAQHISELAQLPGGVNFGTLVHSILEVNDPASQNLSEDLLTQSQQALDVFPLDGVEAGVLAEGLEQVVRTPLGDLSDGMSLRDIGARHRLAELDFEMPMGSNIEFALLADLAMLFDDESLADPSGVLLGYGKQLISTPAAHSTLHGFLTGSIDAVVQVSDRFAVLDYKTNRIPVASDEVLSSEMYDAKTMEKMMRQAHYPLQALLYMVALHRYLGWRLPGYDPARHLGGAGYLFVRGMVGADTPATEGMPCGVFTWRPDPQLAVRASEIIAGDIR